MALDTHRELHSPPRLGASRTTLRVFASLVKRLIREAFVLTAASTKSFVAAPLLIFTEMTSGTAEAHLHYQYHILLTLVCTVSYYVRGLLSVISENRNNAYATIVY